MTRQILVIIAVLFSITISTMAGGLNPTAPPGETMKTLQEIAPRTPLRQADFPLTITESGSYYLTENVTMFFDFNIGIVINSSDVMIDLMGYTISGPPISFANGISITDLGTNIKIKNGTVKNFGLNGIAGDLLSKEIRITGVSVTDNSQGGISLPGSNVVIKDCFIVNNGDSAGVDVYGIRCGTNAMVINNHIIGNGNQALTIVYGIHVTNNSICMNNIVSKNGYQSAGYLVYGIYYSEGATIKNNTIVSNGSLAHSADVTGIYGNLGGIIVGNTVKGNGNGGTILSGANKVMGIWIENDGGMINNNAVVKNGYKANDYVRGILGASGLQVFNNKVSGNGELAPENVYGIFVGNGCKISGNVVFDNGRDVTGVNIIYGILCGYNNLVTGNTVSKNGDNVNTITGIRSNDGSIITQNNVSENGTNALQVDGIVAKTGCTVSKNNVFKNGVGGFLLAGITVEDFCLIESNTAYSNGGPNLVYGTGCVLVNNVAP